MMLELKAASRNLCSTWKVSVATTSLLAMALGANIAVLSIAKALYLTRPPYAEPERLLQIGLLNTSGQGNTSLSGPMVSLLRDRLSPIGDVAIIGSIGQGELSTPDSTSETPVTGAPVSRDFLNVLGVRVARGRDFHRGGDGAETKCEYIATHALAGRLATLSQHSERSLTIKGKHCTLVGQLSPEFEWQPKVDLLFSSELDSASASYAGDNFSLLLRPRRAVSTVVVQQILNSATQQFDAQHRFPPQVRNFGLSFRAVPLSSAIIRDYTTRVIVMQVVVGLVFLIAFVNTMLVLLGRVVQEHPQTCIRLACGAGLRQIFFQWFARGLLLALPAYGGGILFALALMPVLLQSMPRAMPYLDRISVDLESCGAGLIFVAFLACAFGAAPLGIKAVRRGLVLGRAAGGSIDRSSMKGSRVLLMVQSAAAVILVGSAAVLMTSFLSMRSSDPGFEASGLHILQTDLRRGAKPTGDLIRKDIQRLTAHLEPNLSSSKVAYVNVPPGRLGFNVGAYPASGTVEQRIAVEFRIASPAYFDVLQLRVVKGRPLMEADQASSRRVTVVNLALARRWWGLKDPIGSHIALRDGTLEVVGVIPDVPDGTIGRPATPLLMIPLAQATDNILVSSTEAASPTFLAREHQFNGRMGPEMAPIAALFTPSGTVPAGEILASSLFSAKFYATFSLLFASFCILLTSVAVYGSVAYRARIRAKELAIREALGASMKTLVLTLTLDVLGALWMGVLFGVGIMWAASSLLTGLVYSANTQFAWALLAALILGILFSLLGAVVPASSLVTRRSLSVSLREN